MKETPTTYGTLIYPFTDDPQLDPSYIQVFIRDTLTVGLSIDHDRVYSYIETRQLIVALERAVNILSDARTKALQAEVIEAAKKLKTKKSH